HVAMISRNLGMLTKTPLPHFQLNSRAAMELSLLIAGLSDPSAYPFAAPAVEFCQTHISVVFLAGEFAYKVKKPVKLSFLDFSTLERRRHFCEEEVRLNCRLAPDVYLDVVPVTRAGSQVAFEG